MSTCFEIGTKVQQIHSGLLGTFSPLAREVYCPGIEEWKVLKASLESSHRAGKRFLWEVKYCNY